MTLQHRKVTELTCQGASRSGIELDGKVKLDHAKGMARLTIRLDFENGASLGPGKIRLLEEVEKTGSIRNAAEGVGMSFRQAWLLLKAIEQMFEQPVIETQRGGSRGGGSALTDFGRIVIASYREVEQAAARAASKEVAILEKKLNPNAQGSGRRTIARKALKTKG